MKNQKSILIHETNCWMATPIYLGVFENKYSSLLKKIMNDANRDYHYFKKMPNKTKTYQVGEQVLTVYYLDNIYKKGDRIILDCETTTGSLKITNIRYNKTNEKFKKDGIKISIPLEVR